MHPNLLVATHRPKDSPELLCAVYVKNGPCLIGHRATRPLLPGFLYRARGQGFGALYIIYYIYVYLHLGDGARQQHHRVAHMYIYMYKQHVCTHVHK